MEIPKLKSQSPKFYDNTESDIIIVTECVLDNKLRDLEHYYQARGGIVADIALAITLLIAILTTSFKDFLPYIMGSTIRGVFITGLIVVIIKIGYCVYKLFKFNRQSRHQIINSLKKDQLNKNKQSHSNTKNKQSKKRVSISSKLRN